MRSDIQAAAVFEVIKHRRTARAYRPTAVPQALVRRLLEAVRWAPSAANRQPWELIVIDDDQTKGRIRDAYVEDAATHDAAYQTVSRKQADLLLAPVLIAVCGDIASKEHLVNVESIPETGKEELFLLSIGAAIQNMLLAATSLGLATTWMARPARIEAIRTILDVPDGLRLVAIVCVGYAADEPPFREALRVPISQKTHRQRYGVADAEAEGNTRTAAAHQRCGPRIDAPSTSSVSSFRRRRSSACAAECAGSSSGSPVPSPRRAAERRVQRGHSRPFGGINTQTGRQSVNRGVQP